MTQPPLTDREWQELDARPQTIVEQTGVPASVARQQAAIELLFIDGHLVEELTSVHDPQP